MIYVETYRYTNMFLWIFVAVIAIILNDNVTQSANTVYMRRVIRKYFSEIRNHQTNIAYKSKAKWHIHGEFKRFGLETEFQTFDYQEANFANVIGVRKGKYFGTKNDKIIGVCAHYDTFSETKGVDDNGSGVAAMLEVARQLFTRKVENDHTVIFLSTDLEKDELIGSERFVAEWIPPWFEKNYKDARYELKPYGMIVLDSVMNFNTTSNSQISLPQLQSVFPETFDSIASDNFLGDFIALIYRNSSDDQLAQSFKGAWMHDSRKKFEIEDFRLPVTSSALTSLDMFFSSSHTNFWLGGLPAIFLTDTAMLRGTMKVCHAKLCDDIDVMMSYDNIAFLGKTADTIVSTIITVTSGGTTVAVHFSLVGAVVGFGLSVLLRT